MNRLIRSSLGLLLFLIVSVTSVFAGPAIQTPMKVTQPDGTVLQVQIRGDEYQNWTELLPSGYTIVRNPHTKYWDYAITLPDGTLAPSGIKADPGGRSAPASIPKGLKPPRNQELEKRSPEQLAEAGEPGAAPVSGTRKVLVVLVNFSDRTLVTTPSGWNGKIFDTTSGVKSMVNFWKETSFGAVTVSPVGHSQPGNPAGILTASLAIPHPNYGGNISYDSDVSIANQALAQAASYLDFASYDTNGDGVLDPTELAIYFVYAGYEAAGTSKTPSVWAHAWSGGAIAAGTKTVRYWALNGELNDADAQHPVGVIVHELGHSLFGLIDLYDTSGHNQALGNFSVMAAGSWGADIGEYAGTTPSNLDAWSRQHLGWASPYEPVFPGIYTFAATLSSTTAVYKFFNSSISASEYFLVDNRQPVGWDRGLRGYLGSDWLGGLLILHVDDAIASNRYTDAPHQKVVPVQASTAFCDMLAVDSYCRGHATTLFYYGNNDTWTPESTPNSDFYNQVQAGFSLTHITPPRAMMTATFARDTVPPVLTAFTLPATSTSFTVPITSLNATDNVSVTGYLVKEDPELPLGSDLRWTGVKPVSYTFTTAGAKTLYAWVKDFAGNVSNSLSASVTVLGNDTTAPTVTAFTIPATFSSLTVPITTFTATDDFGVTGYLVNESSAKPAASDPGWSASKPTSYNFATAGSKTLYAWAKDAAGNVSNSRSATVTITTGLPSPWLTQDIGSVGVPGSASYLNGLFTLKGSGANIWGTADAFRFVYQPITGDVTIVARVVSLQNTNQYAKGGIMIRQSLAANSMHAMMDMTPTSTIGAEFSRRTSTGGSTTVTASTARVAPYWVKLVRSGNTFTGLVAPDGVHWIEIGHTTINMTGTVYVGLIANSHNNTVLTTATIDNVTLPAADTTSPVVTAFAVPPTSNSLYVGISTFTFTDNVAVTGWLINESPVKPAPNDPAWQSAIPAAYNFSSPGVKTLYAWVKDAAGNVSDSKSATVTISTGGVPAPWKTQDIGSVGVAGSTDFANGAFTIKGSGANIYGTADAFRFVYVPVTGDTTIVARVLSVQNTNQWAKGGVMIRQALTANSAHAMVDITPTAGAEFSRRTSTGGSTSVTSSSGKAAPYWVRLARTGSTFTGSISSDGVNWTQLGSATISMSGTVYVGLIANSHNNTVLCSTSMDRINVSPQDVWAPTVLYFAIPVNSSALTIPIQGFNASDNVGVTGYLLNESPSKPAPSAPGWSSTKPQTYTFASTGTKTLYAWAKDAAGNVSDSLSATITITGGGLPAPWLTQDIGSVGIPGSANYADGIFTLTGSGANIWGTADAFRFVYHPMTGDGQITAWVTQVVNTNQWAKGGVMIRQSLTANSMHAMVDITPTSGVEFSRRSSTGGSTTVTSATGSLIHPPYWVRLVRSGNTFTGYASLDGTNWSRLGSATINMSGSVYVGLIDNSHNNSTLCTVKIQGVK